jgi:hypothetical protein
MTERLRAFQAALDRLHARVVRHPGLRLFTAVTRGLLAAGFILPGYKKFLGRFTQLPIDTPVGFFFEALYRAHGFYLFVGTMQVLAGALLLFPLTTTLGAVFYFPLILGILVINVSVGFEGTYVVTTLMTLAATYLLCWDYDRWRSLLPGFGPTAPYDPARHLGPVATALGGAIAGLGGLGAALALQALLARSGMLKAAALLALAAGLGALWATHCLRRLPAVAA